VFIFLSGICCADKKALRADIEYDALGWKTLLAKKMSDFHVAGYVARQPRAGSDEYNTVVMFEGRTANVQAMRSFLESSAIAKQCDIQFSDDSWQDKQDIIIRKTPSSWHRDDSSGENEQKISCDPEIVHSTSKSVASSSDRGSAQAQFDRAMGRIYGSACVLCEDDATSRQAAHISPVNASRTTSLSETGLASDYDPRNGVLLCFDCHKYFDNGYWYINTGGKAVISEALQTIPKYKQLHCHLVRLPHVGTLNRPPDSVLLIQKQFCDEKKVTRHDLKNAKPLSCDQCGMRYVQAKSLNNHKNKCVKPRFRKLFSPDKKRSRYLLFLLLLYQLVY